MLAIGTLLVLVGYAVGRLHTDALHWTRAREPRPLPAATARGLARQRRRNRADLRHVLPAREVGVRLVERPYVVRTHPSLSVADFDEERTR